jgi:hypothetical protein
MAYIGVRTLFQNLVASVQLKPEQAADAAGKHERVRRVLNRWYYSLDSGSANSLVVGSYGKDTEIRPPSDVDVLFQLPWSVFERFKGRTGNIQSQLLQEVKYVLEKSFSSTAMRGDGQVVMVPFATYAIEVLPAFRLTDGKYWYPDTNAGGRWQTTDPAAERSALVQSNARTGGKTIHLVKLLKAWKQIRSVSIKSFVLELIAQDFLDQWAHNKDSGGAMTGYAYYDFMMRDFFAYLGTKKLGYLFSPGTYDLVHLGDAWEAQARFAANAAARATTLGAEDKLDRAKEEWRNIFGYYLV